MGGTGGDPNQANPAMGPKGFAGFGGSGSGAGAGAGSATPPGWAGLMSETSPAVTPEPAAASPASGSPLFTNPTVAPTTAAPAAITSTPSPTGVLPHIGAPDKAPVGFTHTPYETTPAPVPEPPAPAPAPEPAKPAEVPMRQIWQPTGGGTAAQWLAANPNWETDFNRAEQRADGTWWVPVDPNAPRPAGPQYYQGTGNVVYGGSPPASGGQR